MTKIHLRIKLNVINIHPIKAFKLQKYTTTRRTLWTGACINCLFWQSQGEEEGVKIYICNVARES